MESVTQNTEKSKRYLPHEISTKVHSVETYRKTGDIGYTCRKYHISKASLMRWNRLYDGTRESLMPKSHRPHKAHPKAHKSDTEPPPTARIRSTSLSFASFAPS